MPLGDSNTDIEGQSVNAEYVDVNRGKVAGRQLSPLHGGDRRVILPSVGDMSGTSAVLKNDAGVYSVLYHHGDSDLGSQVRVMRTHDFVNVIEDFAVSTPEDSGFGNAGSAVMDNGRLGALLPNIDGSNNRNAPVFMYSDDGGASWNTTLLTGLTGLSGYTLFSENGVSGGHVAVGHGNNGSNLNGYRTTDNGDSWTDLGVVATYSGGSFGFIAEPEVIHDRAGRYIMFARIDSTGGENFPVWTTTDPTDFGSGVDSGSELDQNRPVGCYYNGMAYISAASREYQGNEIGNYGNAMLYQTATFDSVFNDPTDWPGWSVLTRGVYGPHGYGNIVNYGGEVYQTITVNERRTGDLPGAHGYRDIALFTNTLLMDNFQKGATTRLYSTADTSFGNAIQSWAESSDITDRKTADELGMLDGGKIIANRHGRYLVAAHIRFGEFDWSSTGNTRAQISLRCRPAGSLQNIKRSQVEQGDGEKVLTLTQIVEMHPGEELRMVGRGAVTGVIQGASASQHDTNISVTLLR